MEEHNVPERTLLAWFGRRPWAFAGEATYKGERSRTSTMAAPYREFGGASMSLRSRRRALDTFPAWVRDLVPASQVGPWEDAAGRHYKFEADANESDGTERWSVRVPIAMRRRGTAELDAAAVRLPEIGDKLTLRRDDLASDVVVCGVGAARDATAAVLLRSLQK